MELGARDTEGFGFFLSMLGFRKQTLCSYRSSGLCKYLTALPNARRALCRWLEEYGIKHISGPNELQSKHGKKGKKQCHWLGKLEHGKIKQVVEDSKEHQIDPVNTHLSASIARKTRQDRSRGCKGGCQPGLTFI